MVALGYLFPPLASIASAMRCHFSDSSLFSTSFLAWRRRSSLVNCQYRADIAKQRKKTGTYILLCKNHKVGLHSRISHRQTCPDLGAGHFLQSVLDGSPRLAVYFFHFNKQSVFLSGFLVACRNRAQRARPFGRRALSGSGLLGGGRGVIVAIRSYWAVAVFFQGVALSLGRGHGRVFLGLAVLC